MDDDTPRVRSEYPRQPRIVIASGYFDPLHIGHIKYLTEARELGEELWVIVNNDDQARLKKNKPFMRAVERAEIVASLRMVDHVRIAFDTDKTVLQTLEWLVQHDPHDFMFVKGGDSTIDNTPEMDLCRNLGVQVRFGVGGDKVQSSSWLTNGLSQ